MIELCTLTGVDEKTDLDRLIFLSAKYEFVEWGFLYSPREQGKPGRYMPWQSLLSVLDQLPQYVRCALHVCGRGVDNLLSGEPVEWALINAISERGGRVQLNFNSKRAKADERFDEKDIQGLIDKIHPTPVIIQHNKNNEHLWQVLGGENVRFLFDSSGGSGELCKSWPAPLPVLCGYAGGLGPGQMSEHLDAIRKVADARSIWVDMEGRLRVQTDWADEMCLEKCEHVLYEVDNWLKDREMKLRLLEKDRLAEDVLACFDAAYIEGLADVLADTTDSRLKDLVERRLLPAMQLAKDHIWSTKQERHCNAAFSGSGSSPSL